MTFPAIAASLLAADLACLGDEIRAMTHAGVDVFHWDIMDGHFVPNLSFGPDHVERLRSATPVYFDVHLMVTHPENWIDAFAAAGADAISFHAELPQDHLILAKQIRSHDVDVGLAFNPETPLSAVDASVLDQVDRILIMTVKPGFGGQNYIDQSQKIRDAAKLKEKHPHLQIVIDGGINDKTAQAVIDAGATTLVSGSFLFKNKNDYKSSVASLRGGAK